MRQNNGQEKKRRIGITGGVGAGKSRVLEILKDQFHARVILADLVAHELMEPGSAGLSRVIEALGSGFLKEDGSVDRQALGELIFHDEEALQTMNGIIHPMTWKEIEERALGAKESLIVVEAAVFDTAPVGFFDEIWYIYTTKENRIRRLMENRGYTREKCERIMAAQDTEDSYRKRCSRIIDNNKGMEEIKMQLEEILGHEVC